MIKKSLIATLLATALVMSAQAKDIVDTAVDAGSFKTLATALGAAGLIETLKGKGPFTVFAPTDEAFAKIPKADLEALGGFKFEAQHARVIDETPLRVF